MKNEKINIKTIYLVMFRIGAVTYGGGWSIMTQMQEEFSDRRGWISKEELFDYMAAAKSLPGIMVINLSVLFGYRVHGIAGAAAAVSGLASPAFITISLLTCFYAALIGNIWTMRIMTGVRCAVVSILLISAIRMKEKALNGSTAYVLMIISFLLCILTGLNKFLMMAAAALFGILFWGGKNDHIS